MNSCPYSLHPSIEVRVIIIHLATCRQTWWWWWVRSHSRATFTSLHLTCVVADVTATWLSVANYYDDGCHGEHIHKRYCRMAIYMRVTWHGNPSSTVTTSTRVTLRDVIIVPGVTTGTGRERPFNPQHQFISLLPYQTHVIAEWGIVKYQNLLWWWSTNNRHWPASDPYAIRQSLLDLLMSGISQVHRRQVSS